jgi:hypothetical protein
LPDTCRLTNVAAFWPLCELFNAAKYSGTDNDGWLLGTLDDVEDLMALSRRSALASAWRT